jgi:hypothetical protein
MKRLLFICALLATGCASPPAADPSIVDAGCAQQCSGHLATCSSGFKFFPVVQQKQCNDTYDVCIKGCPARSGSDPSGSAAERLRALDQLRKTGAISEAEYSAKRKAILEAL